MIFVYPSTKKIEKINTYHGIKVSDPYQWLENYSDKKVQEWVRKQETITHSIIDLLPRNKKIQERLNVLCRYDRKIHPHHVSKGNRIFSFECQKNEEKWVYYMQDHQNAQKVELINPNTWNKDESLSFAVPSEDGKYVAFGKDKSGNENPHIYVMETTTRKILPDSVTGWKQDRVSWLHDNSGFFYSRKPLKGDVPEGEEHYWDEIYFHTLGTSSSEDKKIFFCDTAKEYYHTAHVTEDGRYIVFDRSSFGKNEVFFKHVNSDHIVSIAEGFDAEYTVNIIKDYIIIRTDWKAPRGRVFITSIKEPERKYWKELIPESSDILLNLHPIAGNLYADYLHHGYSQIRIFSFDGKYIRNVPLPIIGDANVYGAFSQPFVWIWFQSFFVQLTIYRYHFENDNLELYFAPPTKPPKNFVVEQVKYPSKDGTLITMFLLKSKDMQKNGINPTFLTGYGGFGVPFTPFFSPNYTLWLEYGGIVAIPHLRGGGEYGKEWHEAGKLEKRQNSFDDFIAAAEWLIDNEYTLPKKLAIYGESNGGLLVCTATMQRPELFRAVVCGVPLLDMLRYHRFKIANTWAVEYGSSDDPQQFVYLYKYSPYHNVRKNMSYPAMLIIASENDSRVDVMHALKMIARLQEMNPHGEPALLLMRRESGHTGGTTLSQFIEQQAELLSFLMERVNMQ